MRGAARWHRWASSYGRRRGCMAKAKPTPKAFKTKNSSSSFWEGFARQTIDFQHAVGELIDNSLSARLPKAAGKGFQTTVIEVTLEELANGRVRLQVADAGTGV